MGSRFLILDTILKTDNLLLMKEDAKTHAWYLNSIWNAGVLND